ncbi:MAG: hypothetical protein V4662_13510 [Verrucomicrobiota bacterium]
MRSTLTPSFWMLSLVSVASLSISLTLLIQSKSDDDDIAPERGAKIVAAPAVVSIPHLALPAAMAAPRLTLPESPLLKGALPPTSLPEFRAMVRKKMALDQVMMNGELDRHRGPTPGSTDPDSMWRGQVDRANRTLHENGMGHLNLKGR